jgi:hypothetical protein
VVKKKMSEKRRVRVFFIGDIGEVKADVYVEPTVKVTDQEGGNRLLQIGNDRALEITLPTEIMEQIRGR